MIARGEGKSDVRGLPSRLPVIETDHPLLLKETEVAQSNAATASLEKPTRTRQERLIRNTPGRESVGTIFPTSDSESELGRSTDLVQRPGFPLSADIRGSFLTEVPARPDHMTRHASIAGDLAAMFLLTQIAEAGELDLKTLNRNLNAPDGWLAFAKLWREDLIDYFAGYASITEAGWELVELFGAALEQTASVES
jgi:hypothetical protein